MKSDYITRESLLPPYLVYPRFLLGMNVRLIAREVYMILLDMAYSGTDVRIDRHGRRYLTFRNKTIAEIIDRTPSTVAQSLRELEEADLIEKKLISRSAPYHVYVKLPDGEDV